jgi:small subunit ribosomal protein S21
MNSWTAHAAPTADWKHFAGIRSRQQCRQALRVLKKKMQREGVFREMKRRRAYEKPSERKTREKAEAIRRARKAARKLAQREGLLPMPKRREAAPRRAPLPRSL